MMKKKTDLIEIVACNKCKGTGLQTGAECPECEGVGQWGFFRGKVIFTDLPKVLLLDFRYRANLILHFLMPVLFWGLFFLGIGFLVFNLNKTIRRELLAQFQPALLGLIWLLQTLLLCR